MGLTMAMERTVAAEEVVVAVVEAPQQPRTYRVLIRHPMELPRTRLLRMALYRQDKVWAPMDITMEPVV